MSVPLQAGEYGAGRPVAILHGLFGAGRNWTGIARRLADRHRVVVFDLRNHGAAGWAATMSYPEMAEDVRAAMIERGYPRYALLGHSMGGKVAMVAALQDAEAVERLLVVDVAPVAYAIPYRAYVTEMRGLDLSGIARRSEADAALAATIADPAERGFLLQNLTFATDGPRWQLNLDALDAAMPQIARFPTLPADSRYDGPALFVAGGRSRYLRPEHEAAVRRLFPDARIVRIEDAGHLLHVERAEAFLALAYGFLDA
jgi:pimeloyl-ACP methyl ester carboxylesterase